MNIPLWLIFALGSMFTFGLFSFIQKYSASVKKYDSSAYVFFLYFMGFLISTVFVLIFGIDFIETKYIVFAFLTAVFHTINSKTRFVSLRYLSSSFHFINYRLITGVLLLILGYFLFGETLTWLQLLGIASGFVVFFLLYEKQETKREGFEMGLVFLGISILLITAANIINKYITLNINDFISYIFFYYLSTMIVLIVQGFSQKNFDKILRKHEKAFYILSAIQAFCFYSSLYLLLKTLEIQSLAIAYKIYSFEIIVPITLSILFLGEKITVRKVLAFIFTVLSIFFFL